MHSSRMIRCVRACVRVRVRACVHIPTVAWYTPKTTYDIFMFEYNLTKMSKVV